MYFYPATDTTGWRINGDRLWASLMIRADRRHAEGRLPPSDPHRPDRQGGTR